MNPELRNLSYEECLKECVLKTLETTRLRGDQIEVIKKLNGYKNSDFSQRTINEWNKLSKDSIKLAT